jgi:ribulose-5-phosphate 4-epimerase/fuculose-1-phosphate aldolase
MNLNDEAKARLAQGHQILHMEGLAEDTYRGHITLKTESEIIYTERWAVGFQGVREMDLLGVDLEGNLVEGEELADLMGERLVILMKNHGIVTAGRSLEEAVVLAIDFEKAAKEHLTTALFGNPTEVPTDTAKKMSSRIFNGEQYRMMWDFYCRKLERVSSTTREGGTSS